MSLHLLSFRTVSVILVLVALISACSNTNSCDNRPCSLSEIRSRLTEAKSSIPVYVPKTGSLHSNIDPIFYYSDNGSETRLWTRFISNETGIPIAGMNTSFFLEPLDMTTTRSATKVFVDWADGAYATKWELLPEKFINGSPLDAPWQTFIVWRKGNMWFHFCSTLPLDETLEFINTLEETNP